MPQGGKLALTTETVDGESVRGHAAEATAARYVCIGVTDTGMGMDETVLQRIFEPFFTTKMPNQGTGLGLAVAYGIVKNHSGFIYVESKPNEGTNFRLYLPALPS
jgi:signal transduction histidine kinase